VVAIGGGKAAYTPRLKEATICPSSAALSHLQNEAARNASSHPTLLVLPLTEPSLVLAFARLRAILRSVDEGLEAIEAPGQVVGGVELVSP
jgi:hypothetical protein